MANELKPCPFCGNASMSTCEYGAGFGVSCNRGSCMADLKYFDTLEEAIAAWNTRPLESQLTQAREELAEARRLAQWTPITAENLPVEGDELLHADGSVKHFEAANPNIDEEWDAEDYNEWQWLWKRPIAPPTEAARKGEA